MFSSVFRGVCTSVCREMSAGVCVGVCVHRYVERCLQGCVDNICNCLFSGVFRCVCTSVCREMSAGLCAQDTLLYRDIVQQFTQGCDRDKHHLVQECAYCVSSGKIPSTCLVMFVWRGGGGSHRWAKSSKVLILKIKSNHSEKGLYYAMSVSYVDLLFLFAV